MTNKIPISEGLSKEDAKTLLAFIHTGRDILDGSAGSESYDQVFKRNKSNIEVVRNSRNQLLLQIENISENNIKRYIDAAISNLSFNSSNQRL